MDYIKSMYLFTLKILKLKIILTECIKKVKSSGVHCNRDTGVIQSIFPNYRYNDKGSCIYTCGWHTYNPRCYSCVAYKEKDELFYVHTSSSYMVS